MTKISLVIITKDPPIDLLDRSIQSALNLIDEIIIIDDSSNEQIYEIVKKYNIRLYKYLSKDLGKKRAFGLSKAENQWILVLDADEILSEGLQKEIKSVLNTQSKYSAYQIPRQNHLFEKPLKYGGELYNIIRLFKKDAVQVASAVVHEEYKVMAGKVSNLKNPILHYTYRTYFQTLKKMHEYGLRIAKVKHETNESSSIKKILKYPLHMFWARFIEDKGYKDGLTRVPLDIIFAYSEFITYLRLFIYQLCKHV